MRCVEIALLVTQKLFLFDFLSPRPTSLYHNAVVTSCIKFQIHILKLYGSHWGR